MFKRWKSLKMVLVLALAAVMLTSWVAFSAAETVTITWATDSKSGPPGFKMREDVIIKLFEERNPGIKVKLQQCVGTWQDKITAQFAAGNPPDVVIAFGPALRKWVDTGQGLCLDDYVTEEVKDYDPKVVALYGYGLDGRLYTLPATFGWFTLFYNKDMFDKAGVSYPDNSWDWNSLLEASKKLTKKESGKPGEFGYQVVGFLDWNLSQFIWQNGGHVTPNDVDPGDTILIDSPEAIEALEFVHDMVWKHHVAPKPAEMGDLQAWNTFLFGRVAMQINGYTDFKFNTEGAKFRWDIAQLPKGPVKRAVRGSGDGIMVSRRTKYPDEAVKFLRFYVSPEVQEILMKEEGLTTGRLSIQARYAELAPFPNLNLKAFSKDAPYAIPAGRFFKDAPKVYEMLTPVLEKIFVLNKLSVKEGIPEISEKINAYLAKAE